MKSIFPSSFTPDSHAISQSPPQSPLTISDLFPLSYTRPHVAVDARTDLGEPPSRLVQRPVARSVAVGEIAHLTSSVFSAIGFRVVGGAVLIHVLMPAADPSLLQPGLLLLYEGPVLLPHGVQLFPDAFLLQREVHAPL